MHYTHHGFCNALMYTRRQPFRQVPKLAMKAGRYCCHQPLFQIGLHALFKTANFVTNMKFKGLEQQNLSTITVTAATGLKV